uniref:Ephrin-A3 n=1 Tax=Astyanax mexicanus TaxID=7994 RepID=A0A3B1KEM7_ASTMX
MSRTRRDGGGVPGEGSGGIMALAGLALVFLTNFYMAEGSRHAVYWNSSNIHLRREGYTLQVNVNDYLDIYCPHYNSSQRGVAEQYVLYMVSYRGYRTCDPQLGFKRWECNRPHAPHAPIKFSEKFQRYSAFSLGYEFHVGHEYYYISTPTHHHGRSCLRLRVYVCCSTGIDPHFFLSFFLSLSFSFLSYLRTFIHPSIHASIQSISENITQYSNPSTNHQSILLSTSLSIHLSIHPPIHLFTPLSN